MLLAIKKPEFLKGENIPLILKYSFSRNPLSEKEQLLYQW